MKKLAYSILSAALFSVIAVSASAQGQSRSVSGFNAISSGGPFNVHVKIDGNESLKIDADNDIINDIETTVEGNTLKIKFKDRENRHWNNRKVDIYVEAKSLNALANAGSGSLRVEGVVSGGNVKTILSGSGDISTAVKADQLRTVISGSGSIKITGSAGEAQIVVTGSGQVEGSDLKTNSVSATITGSGNIHVQAEKSVSGHITGSGNVIYSGSASITDVRTTGSGRVSRE
ncbi:MAG TPA: head GIN domain-containing protein [Mucilaginibacter sp.]|nr:head GIN domain-containing protein [Mucilaginibacter sp.]